MSNLFSVKNIFASLGFEVSITSSINEINSADALIIPGVGAFGEAMASLSRLELIQPIKEFIASGKPCLGICLGFQLLFSKSYEFGEHAGLDIIKGDVIKFSNTVNGRAIRVPNVGWNQISEYASWENTPLQGLKNNEFVYFVHSYYVKPEEDKWILSTAQYGDLTYCASIQRDNIFATQFHPEKSGAVGMAILQNWINRL